MDKMEEATHKNKRERLTLKRVCEGLQKGVRKNGREYAVRDDRSRYYWPDEWIKFINTVKPEKRIIFEFLINTGGRIDEILHVKPKDFDWDRNNLTLRVTKMKKAKGERIGKPRTFQISSQFAKKARKYIKENKITDDELIFKVTYPAVRQLMRRMNQKSEIKDWWNFALHNVRKTHGNYLKAMGIPAEEICMRLGHDFNTYLKHYGSANVFDRRDKMLIAKILGDVYGFK